MFVRRCPGCRNQRGGLCRRCLHRFDGSVRFDLGSLSGTALADYDHLAKRVILAAKNGGRLDVLRCIGRQLGRTWFNGRSGVDSNRAGQLTVSWVPASRSGRRHRGFDQGQVLARAAAAEIGRLYGDNVGVHVRHQSLLTRVDRRPQTGQPRTRRLAGPDLRWAGHRVPSTVLLVDDVVTTGSSLRVASDVLARNGVSYVAVLAAASVR